MEGFRHVINKIRAARFIIVLFCFFIVIGTQCKTKTAPMETRSSVKGILSDSTGSPVKGAVVMIADGSHEFTDMASVTNDSGEFYLSNIVIPGRYVLQIQSNNGSKRKEVNLTNNDTIQIDL
jgi:hypothetical protein